MCTSNVDSYFLGILSGRNIRVDGPKYATLNRKNISCWLVHLSDFTYLVFLLSVIFLMLFSQWLLLSIQCKMWESQKTNIQKILFL